MSEMLSTRKSQTDQDGDETFGRVLVQLRSDLIEMLCRSRGVSVDVAEDAVAEAVTLALGTYDPIALAIEASKWQRTFEDHLLGRLHKEAKNYIGRERRKLKKHLSENTPLGDDPEGELQLKGLFTTKSNTVAYIESFAECMMFFRKHGRAFSPTEIDALFGIGDNVSVLDAAKELGLTPEDVAKLRTNVSARARSRMGAAP